VDERAWDLWYDIFFLDEVVTHNISQFQLLRPHRRCRCLPCQQWWALFHSYMGRMLDKTLERMINWQWDNPRALRYGVEQFNPETPSSGKVKHYHEDFSWYGSDVLRATIEPPSCSHYKPTECVAIRPLNGDGMINEDDDDENWVDPGGPSSGRSRVSDDNDNDDTEGEEETHGGEKGTGKGKRTKDGKGKGKGKGKGTGKETEEGRGGGREMVMGKVLLNKPQWEMISLVLWLCSWRRKCMRKTRIQRANWSG